MTQKQYETLKPYKDTLFSAYHLSYARLGNPEMIAAFDEVSKELFGSGINGGCSHCVMSKLKQLAKPFFEMEETEKKRLELEAKAKQEAEEKARLEQEAKEKQEQEAAKTAEQEKAPVTTVVQPINNTRRTRTNNNGSKNSEQKPKGKGSKN